MSIDRAEISRVPKDQWKHWKLTAAMTGYAVRQWLPQGSLPEVVVRASAVGGTVGTLGAIDKLLTPTPVVEAADPQCRVRLLSIGVGFIDNPVVPNRTGLVDTEDFAIGEPDFGVAVLNYLEDPKNLKSARREVARTSMVPRGNGLADALFDLTEKSNTKGSNGGDAIEVRLSFTKDPLRQAANSQLPVEEAVVIRCGNSRPYVSGRYATEEAIRLAARGRGIDKVGTLADRRTREVLKGPAGFAPKVDNPGVNVKDLINRLEEALKHGQDVREKERRLAQTATPSPTSTPRPPTATPTPTSTATPTATPEAAPPPPGEEAPPGGDKGFNLDNIPGLVWFRENLLPPILQIDNLIRTVTGRIHL